MTALSVSPNAIEIEELREAGEDGGDHMGYFARGHYDKHDFARAANAYSQAFNATDRRHVEVRHVRHIWWRTAQMDGEPRGVMCFHVAEPGSKGAWKATVAEPESEWSDRQYKMRRREFERGRRSGYEDALRWLLLKIEFGAGRSVTSDTLEMRRQIIDDVRRLYSAEAIDREMEDTP